jgi:hypothetical protein
VGPSPDRARPPTILRRTTNSEMRRHKAYGHRSDSWRVEGEARLRVAGRGDQPFSYSLTLLHVRLHHDRIQGLSIGGRGSSTDGKNNPARNFGIDRAPSPALVVNNAGRDPLRSVAGNRCFHSRGHQWCLALHT